MKNKYWKIAIPIILLIIIIAGACWFIFKPVKPIALTFKENKMAVIEYGTKDFKSSDLIKQVDGDIQTYPSVDTLKLGKQELSFHVKKGKKAKTFTYTVEVKDTQKPIIKLKETNIEVVQNETYDPKSNIQSIEDPVDGALAFKEKTAVKENDTAYYTITSNVDTKTVGNYQVRVDAMDNHKNTSTETYQVEVSAKTALNPSEKLPKDPVKETPQPQETEKPPVSNAVTSPTYINGILIVNKTYGLPKDFIGNGPNGADQTAYNALIQLQEGAIAAGYEIPMISGYRSYDYQVTLYNNYVQQDGKEAADRYSARPGFSEHQTGLCFDIGDIDNYYGDTPAGKWLDQHAHEYGYIIRYPNGKEGITGYMYEPWHVRYVGKDVASAIKKANSTLEEYLGVAK